MLSVKYGSKLIEFDLVYSSRKTLGITVEPDTSVVVSAPDGSELTKILEKVEKRSRWIVKQQRYFEMFLPATPKRQYISGESHFYLGKQYKLKVIKGTFNEVKLQRGILKVFTKNSDKEKVKLLLSGWYRNHAEYKFDQVIQDCLVRFKKYKIQPSGVELKRMEKRWGSCTPSGKIILNPEIIKAPSHCIEYVVMHELCHLVHPNHSKKFHQLQNKMMPDWSRWKNRLEQMMI